MKVQRGAGGLTVGLPSLQLWKYNQKKKKKKCGPPNGGEQLGRSQEAVADCLQATSGIQDMKRSRAGICPVFAACQMASALPALPAGARTSILPQQGCLCNYCTKPHGNIIIFTIYCETLYAEQER